MRVRGLDFFSSLGTDEDYSNQSLSLARMNTECECGCTTKSLDNSSAPRLLRRIRELASTTQLLFLLGSISNVLRYQGTRHLEKRNLLEVCQYENE